MRTTLTLIDIAALSPLLILLAAALVILLMETFADKFCDKHASWVAFVFIAVAMIAAYYAPTSQNPLITSWLRFDNISFIFTLLFLGIALGVVLLSHTFFIVYPVSKGEYYFFFLSSLLGLMFIVSSADFLMLFLGIETLSISLYVLCAYMKRWKISYESALKYFLMGSFAAAFLLYGIGLIYGALGTTQLDKLLDGYKGLKTGPELALFLGGISLVTLGLAFEAAIVPFHVWAPDVYEGAPTPITAFMSVGTKVGAFAAFVRIFAEALPQFHPLWNQAIAWLAIPTLIYANFVALRQYQLRRFFAYSGISHAGFLLIPIAVGTPEAFTSLVFYLVVYTVATLGAFAIVTLLDHKSIGVYFQDLQGLFRRSPLLACIFALCLLTLAGIPPTAGFLAKFYIFKQAFQAGYYAVVIVGLLTTVLSAFYYLRIIGIMFSESPDETTTPIRSKAATTLAVVSLLFIFFLSVYPTPLLSLIQLAK